MCLQHTVLGAATYRKQHEPLILCWDISNLFLFFAQKNLEKKEGALSGSQRQRGMYLNAGSSDAGIDPDWDPIERKWKGAERREKEARERLERRKQQEDNK